MTITTTHQNDDQKIQNDYSETITSTTRTKITEPYTPRHHDPEVIDFVDRRAAARLLVVPRTAATPALLRAR